MAEDLSIESNRSRRETRRDVEMMLKVKGAAFDFIRSRLWDINEGDLTNSTLLFEGLLDSLDTLKLVAFIEENFHIHVEDVDISPANFGTIDSIATYVARKAGLSGR